MSMTRELKELIETTEVQFSFLRPDYFKLLKSIIKQAYLLGRKEELEKRIN